MSEWVWLLGLAYALYLFECLAWIDSGGWASFLHPINRRWRCSTGETLPGNERGGIVLVNPAQLSGALVICRPWPFSISPDGISTVVPDALTGMLGDAWYIPFDSIESVTTDQMGILINGKRVARVSSSQLALHLADIIERIRHKSWRKRASAIKTAIRHSVDYERAAMAWTAFRQRTVAVSMSSAMLFGYVFAVVPIVVFLVGPYPSWQYLLAGLMLATLATALTFHRAHARLYPQCPSDRWMNILSMVLLPVGAIRALDKLSRDALCEFNPVATIPLLCGNDAAVPLLRQYVIDLSRLPANDEGTQVDSDASRCAQWYQRILADQVASALEILEPLLIAPPKRDDESVASYCPRCHSQFAADGGTCADCPGVELISFSDGATLPEASRQSV